MSGLGKSFGESYGYLLIVAAEILWGTIGILAKLSFAYGIYPETLIALRLLISFSTLLTVLMLVRRDFLRIRKADVSAFLIFGLFAVALQRVAYFYAVDLTTATVAAVLFYTTYPTFVTLSAWIFLKEKVSLRELLAIMLTFLGVALVTRIYDAASLSVNLLGIFFGLLSTLLAVLFFMMTKKLRSRYSSWTLTVYGDGIGALVLTPVISLSLPQMAAFPPQLWLLILAIAWVPSLLAYLLFSHALKYVKASKGSTLSVIEPLSTALFSAVFLREALEQAQMLGIAILLVGVALLFKTYRKTS